jgi:hypothetical protein
MMLLQRLVFQRLTKAEERLVMLPTEVVGATIFPVAIWALFVANVMVTFKA